MYRWIKPVYLLCCYLLTIVVETESTNCTMAKYNHLTCSNVPSMSAFDVPFEVGQEPILRLSIVDSNLSIISPNFFQAKSPNLTSLHLLNAGIEEINPGALDGLNSLSSVQISFNPLKTLQPNSLSKKLYYLNLSRNNITHIEDNVFSGMEKLEELNLEGNQLEEVSQSLTHDCKELNTFDVSHNKIRKIKSNSFRLSLHKIDLSHNSISEIESDSFPMIWWLEVDVSYNNLTVLEDYTFSRFASGINKFNASHNKIKLVKRKAFDSASYLDTIDLSHNDISDLSNESPCGIASLTHLYLSHNHLSAQDVELLAQCTKLEFLDLSHNRIEHLQQNTFNDSFLKKIDLSNNQIRELDISVFSGKNGISVLLQYNKLKTIHGNGSMLSRLNVANNKIEKIESNTFKNSPYLYDLDLSYNEISVVGVGALAIPATEVELKHNKIESFDSWFVNGSRIRHLNVSHNKIDRIEVGSLEGAKNLNILDLSHNSISDIATNALSSSSLKELYLNNNQLTVLRNNAFNLSELYNLVVSFNKIKILESKTFEGTTRLYRLDLSYNEIEVLSPEVFKNTTSLRVLYIQHNFLTVLQDRTFENCDRLQILDFSHNNINNISWNLYHFFGSYEKFRLDLSHNELTEIHWQMFPYFPQHSSDVAIDVNLSNNKIDKRDLESFVTEIVMFRQWNPYMLVNATLDVQSCQNFQKRGDCIVTKTKNDSECIIEVKQRGTCSTYNV